MEVQDNLTFKKKRELLGPNNKRKMTLRKQMDNIKQKEGTLDVSQVTKCVFLGSLCLKPVPHLFETTQLIEDMHMKVGNIKCNEDIVIIDENGPNKSSSNSELCFQDNTSRKKSLLRDLQSKRKYFNINKAKHKSNSESNNNIFNSFKDEHIKVENTQNDDLVIFLPESKAASKSPEIDESILNETDPLDIVFEKVALELSIMHQEEPSLENEEIITSDLPNPTAISDIFEDSQNTPNDIVLKRQEVIEQKVIIENKPLETKPETYTTPPTQFDQVLMKREPTPELLISDSDDDTIDQLMYNIMDIKINPNVFENKDIYAVQQPAEPAVGYDEYEFNEKINPSELDERATKEKKPSLKRTPQCKICSRVFPSYIKLRKHKMAHNGAKPYICLKCNANHRTLDQLIAHLRKHQGKSPYVCKKCNKDFQTLKGLENHQPVHVLKKVVTPKRIFMCEVCCKEFSKLCDLERHSRVHTGEKPSVCNICYKRFQQQHNLNKHLLIHTQEKPFQCDVCNKKFGRSDVLSRHLLTHSVRKPNRCEICLKSFIRVSQLLAHKEKYHAGVSEAQTDPQTQTKFKMEPQVKIEPQLKCELESEQRQPS